MKKFSPLQLVMANHLYIVFFIQVISWAYFKDKVKFFDIDKTLETCITLG